MDAPALADKVRAEIDFCYQHVPLVRQKFHDAGLRPQDIRSPAQLRLLPPTSRAEYRANFPAGVLAEGKTLASRFVLRSQSSGTAGDRSTSVTHTYVLAERMDATLDVHTVLAALFRRTPLRAARYGAPNCSAVECASPTIGMEERTLPDGTLVLPVAHDLFGTPLPMVDLAIDELSSWQPDYLYCDPTHLAFLVAACRQRGVSQLPGDAVVLTYTMATRPALRQLREFFPAGLPIVEVMSMSEFGWLGMCCAEETMHLNNQSFFLELLADGRPAVPGDLADLYVSTVGDRLAPRLRYHTGDLYTVLDQCPCGHRFPAVRFAGRRRDLICRPDGSVLTPRAIDDLVGADPRVTAYRLYQPDEARVRLEFIGPAEAAPAARAALGPTLGSAVRVDVQAVGYLPGQRSGKYQPCVSDVSARRTQREEQM